MKFDPKVVQDICLEAFKELGIPTSPSEVNMSHASEILFIAAVSEAICLGSNLNITSERRREILNAVGKMDELITKKANEIADNLVKSTFN